MLVLLGFCAIAVPSHIGRISILGDKPKKPDYHPSRVVVVITVTAITLQTLGYTLVCAFCYVNYIDRGAKRHFLDLWTALSIVALISAWYGIRRYYTGKGFLLKERG
jgi:hypothetical protein